MYKGLLEELVTQTTIRSAALEFLSATDILKSKSIMEFARDIIFIIDQTGFLYDFINII